MLSSAIVKQPHAAADTHGMPDSDRPDFLQERRGFVPVEAQKRDIAIVVGAALAVLLLAAVLGRYGVAIDALSAVLLTTAAVLAALGAAAAAKAKRLSAASFLTESSFVTRIFAAAPCLALLKGVNPIMPTVVGLLGIASAPIVGFMLWRWEHEIRRTRFLVTITALALMTLGSLATLFRWENVVLSDVGLRGASAVAWGWWLHRSTEAIRASVARSGVKERPQTRQRGARLEDGQRMTSLARLAQLAADRAEGQRLNGASKEP